MQCPFCQGEISDSAVRCRHCQKSLYPSSYGQNPTPARTPTDPSASKAAASTPAPPPTAPPPRVGFGGGPPKDWTPPGEPAPPAASPPAAAPPPRVGFSGGPPKDWTPPGEPTPPAASPPAAAPPRAGFAGGPPKDWAPPAPEGGAEGTLWAIAQEGERRDDRVRDEAQRQREARRENLLEDVRSRAEAVQQALEHDLPEDVLALAHASRDYIATLPDTDDEIDAERRKIERIIDKLESAGYRAAGELEGMAQVRSMSTAAKRGLAIVLVLTILVGWGIYALLAANEAENARIPGSITGTVSIDREGGLVVRVPRENVRLVAQTDASRVLSSKLIAYKNRKIAFGELRTERGALPAIAEGSLDPVGQFVLQNVPPGKYYLIVVTSKWEEDAGAWMFPVEVQPTRITDVKLDGSNRL